VRVYIVGTGYVGLVTAVCLADLGHQVCGVDINSEKIQLLQEGGCPIYEPGLEDLLKKNIDGGRLSFKVDIGSEINDYDVVIIAVGTPERERDGRADLYYVAQTAKQIALHATKDSLIVIGKSTVPTGTAKQISESLISHNKITRFHVGSNPETLREGNAVHDFMNPDRIIMGGDNVAINCLQALYEKISCAKVITDTNSAEMIKLTANFMLAQRISTTNALAQICEATGANVEKVMEGVGLDKRIGPHFLQAGVGYGGSCFPKDTKSIISIAEHHRIDPLIFKAVVDVNESQIHFFMRKVEEMAIMTLKNRSIAVWGVAFKPETDDVRDAPSIKVINALIEEGALVRVFDPVATVPKPLKYKITCCKDMYEAAAGAEILLIVTEWNCFKQADMSNVKLLMETAKIVDGRNIFDPQKMRELGFEYSSIGRS